MQLFGAIDQGTSSTRFSLFDENGATIHQSAVPITVMHSGPGHASICPGEILQSVRTAIGCALPAIGGNSLKCIGIANQRETVIAWNSHGPVSDAIVWHDTHTAGIVEEYRQKAIGLNLLDRIQMLTGLTFSTYFSVFKMIHLKRMFPDEMLQFGTVDSFLIKVGWSLSKQNMTGGHLTDPTNASRTMLMNLQTMQWDPFLLDFFGISLESLPKIEADGNYGQISSQFMAQLAGVPIAFAVGDQQAALVGGLQNEKITFGTGAFFLGRPSTSQSPADMAPEMCPPCSGLLTTVVYDPASLSYGYALEGSIPCSGSLVSWAVDVGLAPDSATFFEKAAKAAADKTGNKAGLMVFPCFSGTFSPDWNPHVRGAIVGLDLTTDAPMLCRAVSEAIAFESRFVLERYPRGRDGLIVVDGGLSKSDYFLQLLSDVLARSLTRPLTTETTSLGAAICAAKGAMHVRGGSEKTKTFVPDTARSRHYSEIYSKWAVQRREYGQNKKQ